MFINKTSLDHYTESLTMAEDTLKSLDKINLFLNIFSNLQLLT